jgi:hypothetical protein
VSVCVCVCVFISSVSEMHPVVFNCMVTVPLKTSPTSLHVLQSTVNSVTGVQTSEVVLELV